MNKIRKGDEVIVITGYASLESAIDALRLGAYDYLIKPFDDLDIVVEKIRLAADKKILGEERQQLMEQVMAANQELRMAQERLKRGYLQTLASMIAALEARDAYTRGHSDRVAEIAGRIAQGMYNSPGAMPALTTQLQGAGMFVEMSAPLDQFQNPLRRFADDHLYDIRIAQISAGRYGVLNMGLEPVLRVQHAGDPSLRVAAVGLFQLPFGNHQHRELRIDGNRRP